MTKDDEYYTTLTRMTILKRDDYFMEIENISEDIFTENQRYQEKIQQIQPIW